MREFSLFFFMGLENPLESDPMKNTLRAGMRSSRKEIQLFIKGKDHEL